MDEHEQQPDDHGPCPLPDPEPTDMPGCYLVHEGGRYYSVQVGAIATDEHCRVWRLVEHTEARWEVDGSDA